MAANNDLFTIQGYQTCLLQVSDADELQTLLERCSDYMLLVDGHPARPSAALSLFSDYPPGKTSADLIMAGIYNPDGKLVGLLHAFRNYPATDACWIGLLLIDPEHRNRGLGGMAVQSFEAWMSSQGAQGILLGVVEENGKALSFWQSLGYTEVERRPPTQFGNLSHVVIVMAHALSELNNA